MNKVNIHWNVNVEWPVVDGPGRFELEMSVVGSPTLTVEECTEVVEAARAKAEEIVNRREKAEVVNALKAQREEHLIEVRRLNAELRLLDR